MPPPGRAGICTAISEATRPFAAEACQAETSLGRSMRTQTARRACPAPTAGLGRDAARRSVYPLYSDIRERLGEPLWHDEHGVPRYAPFHPSLLGVYDDRAALFEVMCQSCGRIFPCAAGTTRLWPIMAGKGTEEETLDATLRRIIGWGDAPWHTHEGGGQCAGTTMATTIAGIVSVWEKIDHEWQQVEMTNSQVREILGDDS